MRLISNKDSYWTEKRYQLKTPPEGWGTFLSWTRVSVELLAQSKGLKERESWKSFIRDLMIRSQLFFHERKFNVELGKGRWKKYMNL